MGLGVQASNSSAVIGATLALTANLGGTGAREFVVLLFAVVDQLESGATVADDDNLGWALLTTLQMTEGGRNSTLYVWGAGSNGNFAGDNITVTFATGTALAKAAILWQAWPTTAADAQFAKVNPFPTARPRVFFDVSDYASDAATHTATDTAPSQTSKALKYANQILTHCFVFHGPSSDTFTEDAAWSNSSGLIGTTTLVGAANRSIAVANQPASGGGASALIKANTPIARTGALNTGRSWLGQFITVHPEEPTGPQSRASQMPSAAAQRAVNF